MPMRRKSEIPHDFVLLEVHTSDLSLTCWEILAVAFMS